MKLIIRIIGLWRRVKVYCQREKYCKFLEKFSFIQRWKDITKKTFVGKFRVYEKIASDNFMFLELTISPFSPLRVPFLLKTYASRGTNNGGHCTVECKPANEKSAIDVDATNATRRHVLV